MARTVGISEFQKMMNSERAADERAPGFRAPALSVPEQLQALVLDEDMAGMPIGQVVGLIRLAVEKAHVNATEQEIRDEAERRWLDGKLEETPVEPKPEDRADGDPYGAGCEDCGGTGALYQHTAGCDSEFCVGNGDEHSCVGGSWEPCSGCAPTDRPDGASRRVQVVDVAPDGTVAEVRPAEMTPDRGDVTHHHTVGDDEPRFSGGGSDDAYVGSVEDNVSKLIPTDGAFLNERHKAAPELANLAEKLIDEHGFFDQLRHCRIDYKWRRKGTNSNGKRAIGKLERVSGIWSAYVQFTFVVWLAADTARLARFTDRQVEAALFHQLAHIAKDSKGNWIRIGHDFEGFGSEVRVYGPWTESLRVGGQAFNVAHQMGLFDADDEEDEDADEEVE